MLKYSVKKEIELRKYLLKLTIFRYLKSNLHEKCQALSFICLQKRYPFYFPPLKSKIPISYKKPKVFQNATKLKNYF